MKQISLSKALKLKNKKAALISTLVDRIQSNNSFNEKNPPTYDSITSLEEYGKEVDFLIGLKRNIHKANVAIVDTILTMGETKSKIVMLRGMSTNQGETVRGFGEQATITKTIATISEKERDEKIEFLESALETMQDDLDHYNAVTFIDVPDRI